MNAKQNAHKMACFQRSLKTKREANQQLWTQILFFFVFNDPWQRAHNLKLVAKQHYFFFLLDNKCQHWHCLTESDYSESARQFPHCLIRGGGDLDSTIQAAGWSNSNVFTTEVVLKSHGHSHTPLYLNVFVISILPGLWERRPFHNATAE